MNDFSKKIAENSPFRMWIYHKPGSRTHSQERPIAQLNNKPNMRWAMKFLQNYRMAEIEYVVFKENGQTFGILRDGMYEGKYKN